MIYFKDGKPFRIRGYLTTGYIVGNVGDSHKTFPRKEDEVRWWKK